MTIEVQPTPPQIEHLFVCGLRFEGALQYLAQPSGAAPARFREIRAPKSRRDGGRAWCSAVASGVLGLWPLSAHMHRHTSWQSATSSEHVEACIRRGGLALLQLDDGYCTWWALVTGVERDRVAGAVKALLLLDATEAMPWALGYNARLDGMSTNGAQFLEWRSLDGARRPVTIQAWIEAWGAKPVMRSGDATDQL